MLPKIAAQKGRIIGEYSHRDRTFRVSNIPILFDCVLTVNLEILRRNRLKTAFCGGIHSVRERKLNLKVLFFFETCNAKVQHRGNMQSVSFFVIFESNNLTR